MRIWLDPNKLAALNLTANDVVQAIQEQNKQVAAGVVGQQPAPAGTQFQLVVNTEGRLVDPAEFSRIIIKRGKQGEVVRLSEVGVVDLGAKNYAVTSNLDGKPAATLAIYQLPGSNALSTAEAVLKTMETLKLSFPPGVDYKVVYDTTVFVTRVDSRGRTHADRSHRAGRDRGDALSADLAGDDNPIDRSSCIPHRDVCRHGGFRVFS